MGKDEAGCVIVRLGHRRPLSVDGSKKAIFEKRICKLHHLRNDLDLWHHQVDVWLDGKKNVPTAKELKEFSIKIVQRLYERKVVAKEEILNIKLCEPELTPRRSCSASPYRTPQSDKRSRLEIHQDKKEQLDYVRKRFDFGDEEEQQGVEGFKNKDFTTTEIEYKEKIEEMKQQIKKMTAAYGLIKHQLSDLENGQAKVTPTKSMEFLQKENDILKLTVARLKNENIPLRSCPSEIRKLEDKVKSDQFEITLLQSENTSKKIDLDEMTKRAIRYRAERNDLHEQRKQNSCFNCTINKNHTDRYRAERDEAKQEIDILLQRLNNAEADVKHYKMENHAQHNTIENQKKMILEMENRRDESIKKTEEKLKTSDEKINDASDAIAIYRETEERYKREKEEDNVEIIRLRNERDRTNIHYLEFENSCKRERENLQFKLLELQTEKEETLRSVQKHKTEISQHVRTIENLKKELKEEKRKKFSLKETDDEERQKIVTLKRQIKVLKTERDMLDLKRKDENNRNLREEIESLSKQIKELENILAKERQEWFAIEQKYKQQLIKCNEEKDYSHRKEADLKNKINGSEARLKEQQILFTVERALLEKKVKDLRKERSITDSQKIADAKHVTIEYQKEQMDKKNEELVVLTRKLYSLEEESSTTKKQNLLIKKKYEDLEKQLEDVTQQLQHVQEAESRSENEQRKYEYELENHRKEIEVLVTENQNLREKVEKNREEITKVRSLKIQLEQETHEDEKRKRGYLTTLESAKETMKMKIDSLERDNSAMNDRLRDLQRDLQSQQKLISESDSLKTTMHTMKIDFENLEQRYKGEAEVRKSTDEMSLKYKDENDRLRKERSVARNEVHKLTREKTELVHQLKTESDSSKSEVDKLKTEKVDLSLLFKEESKRDKEKIDKLERENEMLQRRYTSDEKANQHNAYELMQLKNDHDICKQQKTLLEVKLADAEQDKSKLKLKIRQIDNRACHQCTEYIHKIDQLTTEVQELKERETKSINRHCHQCDENEKKTAVLLKNLDKENERNTAVSNKLHKTEKKTQELYEKIEDLVQEKDILQNEKTDLQDRIRSHEQSSLKPCEKCRRNERNMADLQTQLTDLQHKYNTVNSEFEKEIHAKEEIRKINERQHDQILDAASKLKTLKKEKQDIENQLIAYEQSALKPCEKCQSLQREKAELQTQIADLQQQTIKLYSDYQRAEKLNQELHEITQNQQDKISNDSSKLAKLTKEKTDIETRLRELQKANDTGHEVFERKIDILQSDNKDLKNKCNHRDELLSKADKEIRQLKGQNRQLESDKNELEDRLRRRSPQVVADPKNCQNCWKYRNDISDFKREINELRDRLSEAAGNKLRDNNPNIADLSDMNRPTSLAEKFSSLYTDEYTDAMEVIEESMDEAGCVRVMLTWLKSCYDWCERLATEQRELLTTESIGFMSKYHGQKINLVISDRCLIYIKEFQKKIAANSLEAVGQICHVKSVKEDNLVSNNYIIKYIKKCSELCWMMQISDPPLHLNFDVKSGQNLDKNMFNVFTHSGSKIEYLVWPVLYLHKTGPMLGKGVAQGM